jgi:hypothetical protein
MENVELDDIIDLISESFENKEKMEFLLEAIDKKTFKGWELYNDQDNRNGWCLSKNVKNRGWPKGGYSDSIEYTENAIANFDLALSNLDKLLETFPKSKGSKTNSITINPSGRSGGHWCLIGSFDTLVSTLFDINTVINLKDYDYDYDSEKSIWDVSFETIGDLIQVEPNENFELLEQTWEDTIADLENLDLEDHGGDIDPEGHLADGKFLYDIELADMFDIEQGRNTL